jgi:uncharacterized membrane protein (DUF485 family)
MHTDRHDRGDAAISWACTLLAVVPCFAYILALSLVPDALAAQWSAGSRVSVGLVLGLALAAFLVVLSMIYTYAANRRDAGREAARQASHGRDREADRGTQR